MAVSRALTAGMQRKLKKGDAPGQVNRDHEPWSASFASGRTFGRPTCRGQKRAVFWLRAERCCLIQRLWDLAHVLTEHGIAGPCTVSRRRRRRGNLSFYPASGAFEPASFLPDCAQAIGQSEQLP